MEVARWDIFAAGCLLGLALALVLYSCTSAIGHDMQMAVSKEEAQIYDFYAKWLRPKGPFPGNVHRGATCCNLTDCRPVAEIKKEAGQYVVRPEGNANWYKVPPSVIESNQEDPRESPDGYAHVCIIAGAVVCFVEGGGT